MCECDKQNKLATLFLGRKLNFPILFAAAGAAAAVDTNAAATVVNNQVFLVDMNTEYLLNLQISSGLTHQL